MKPFLFLLLLSTLGLSAQDLDGAYESAYQGAEDEPMRLLMILQDGYLTMTSYNTDTDEFAATLGGSYKIQGDSLFVTYEFNTAEPQTVGSTRAIPYQQSGELLTFHGNATWTRTDGGSDSPLAGAWQFAGRRGDDGEIQRRQTGGPRITMKILSGNRFQWIAYNTETAEFMGTGGGTYTTTDDGRYVETIEFFSRDASRVGAELPFRYELKDGEWHHSGNNSKGEPMYEIWAPRGI